MNKKFDIRTIEHQIRRGVVTRKEYNAYLAELPDDSEEGVESDVKYTESYENAHGDNADDA